MLRPLGLKGYRTGGSIHFIVNNQIGFTTYPRYSRSSPYPSDVAKMIEAPIFHVNGDDPKPVVYAAKVATEFRQKFQKPVVDRHVLLSPLRPQRRRRAGLHPAADVQGDPRACLDHRNLLQEADRRRRRHRGEVEKMKADWRSRLEPNTRPAPATSRTRPTGSTATGPSSNFADDIDDPRRGNTGVAIETLKDIGKKITTVPQGFHVHRTIQRFLDNRRKAIETGEGIDWATGEALACCALLLDGHRVRLSGQDSERGTFSQRHSVLIDQESEARHTSFNHFAEKQGRYEVLNSMLSEEAVLGYEYGYTLAEPNALTMWEAQFGDFANGAQVVFDQFISSGERKWLRMSGLVCLLPHGYEGQGPEHSSARLERFLQMCAEDNMQVANCTTPANYFTSCAAAEARDQEAADPDDAEEPAAPQARGLAARRAGPDSTFHRLLWDDAQTSKDEKIKLVAGRQDPPRVLCSARSTFDLLEEREKRGSTTSICCASSSSIRSPPRR
jgi:2-oxoglutarate dehydrogenase E1 component